ncbi:hypothetical protein [Vibrio breoganii]|uniref:hypothetical protein n=1 Tax=Vibrio breoganii TaxID=553239 RepID=UPI000C852DC1|nr:hypothetical protein [Vibrio breoganii]PML15855.1 hypothetical protein BCT84_07580 [Vibrio breoganii]
MTELKLRAKRYEKEEDKAFFSITLSCTDKALLKHGITKLKLHPHTQESFCVSDGLLMGANETVDTSLKLSLLGAHQVSAYAVITKGGEVQFGASTKCGKLFVTDKISSNIALSDSNYSNL